MSTQLERGLNGLQLDLFIDLLWWRATRAAVQLAYDGLHDFLQLLLLDLEVLEICFLVRLQPLDLLLDGLLDGLLVFG